MSALAGLLLVLVLPSMAGAMLLSDAGATAPADRDDPDRQVPAPDLALARGLACGLATWLVGSGLLARTVGLTTTSAWVWSGLVGAASLVVLLLPRHRSRLGVVLGPVGRRLAEVAGLTAVVFLPLAYAIVHTSWSPLGSTPWYYYGLARQVADVGSIPATSLEFGMATPFLNDYHLFTTGTAMLLLQHPGGAMAVTTIVTLIGMLLVALGTVALTTALGAGRLTALLAVPIAVATGIAPIRLAAYRPEGFALGLCLLLVALSLDWLRRGDRRSLVGAALLAASLSQVHGIAAVTSAVLVAAAALATFLRGPHKEQLRRAGITLAALLGAVVATGLVFRGASGTSTSSGLVDRGGLADPTWGFYRAARGDAMSMPPSNVGMMHDALRSLYDGSRWWIVPALLLALVGLWLRRRDPVVRQLVTFTLASLIGLLVVASVFMFGWQGYVPRRTGASRIVLEISLLAPPFLAIGLGCLTRETWAWRGRRLVPGRRRRLLAILAVLSVCGVVSVLGAARYDDGQAPTRSELATWRSLPLTGSDVVLANGYTEGFIPDVTGAQGLLDGRAPYTFDAQLHHATDLFHGARAFYDDPAKNWDFLGANDVSWVAVGDHDSYSLGTGNIWETPRSLTALEQCPGLERYASSPTLTVFRVVDPGPGGCPRR